MSGEIELKPCPFCGEKKILVTHPEGVVCCGACGARMVSGGAMKWNTRPPAETGSAVREALADCIEQHLPTKIASSSLAAAENKHNTRGLAEYIAEKITQLPALSSPQTEGLSKVIERIRHFYSEDIYSGGPCQHGTYPKICPMKGCGDDEETLLKAVLHAAAAHDRFLNYIINAEEIASTIRLSSPSVSVSGTELRLRPMSEAPKDREIFALQRRLDHYGTPLKGEVDAGNFHPLQWKERPWQIDFKPHWGMRWNEDFTPTLSQYEGWIDPKDLPSALSATGTGGWRPIETLPDFDHRPSRQFILIEGERTHHGVTWSRRYAGEAFIRKDTVTGYRVEDINRLLADGDMDPFNYRVTHWMPFKLPMGMTVPPPPSSTERK